MSWVEPAIKARYERRGHQGIPEISELHLVNGNQLKELDGLVQ